MSNWKVYFKLGFSGNSELYLIRSKGNKCETMSRNDDGTCEIKEFDGLNMCPDIKPILSIPLSWEIEFGFSGQLLQALTDRGISLPDKNFAQGKLEATERHLEDMRRLVFEEPK